MRDSAEKTIKATASTAGDAAADVERLVGQWEQAMRLGGGGPSLGIDGAEPPPGIGLVPVGIEASPRGIEGIEPPSGIEGMELPSGIEGMEPPSGIERMEPPSGIEGVVKETETGRMEEKEDAEKKTETRGVEGKGVTGVELPKKAGEGNVSEKEKGKEKGKEEEMSATPEDISTEEEKGKEEEEEMSASPEDISIDAEKEKKEEERSASLADVSTEAEKEKKKEEEVSATPADISAEESSLPAPVRDLEVKDVGGLAQRIFKSKEGTLSLVLPSSANENEG